jgi:hypothetical protein
MAAASRLEAKDGEKSDLLHRNNSVNLKINESLQLKNFALSEEGKG